MSLRPNKPVRNFGIYMLRDKTLVLFKRSEELSFLFSPENWDRYGPVDYRLSHGSVYCHGQSTVWTDEDLLDTGMTAKRPSGLLLLG